MAHSPNGSHQWISKKFVQKISNEIDRSILSCTFEAFYELDWIIDEHLLVRPDCMIVGDDFSEDFLTFLPTLIVEISSRKTKLRDRNTKYNLYELKGVKYYLIADTETNSVKVFELYKEKYIPKNDAHF